MCVLWRGNTISQPFRISTNNPHVNNWTFINQKQTKISIYTNWLTIIISHTRLFCRKNKHTKAVLEKHKYSALLLHISKLNKVPTELNRAASWYKIWNVEKWRQAEKNTQNKHIVQGNVMRSITLILQIFFFKLNSNSAGCTSLPLQQMQKQQLCSQVKQCLCSGYSNWLVYNSQFSQGKSRNYRFLPRKDVNKRHLCLSFTFFYWKKQTRT